MHAVSTIIIVSEPIRLSVFCCLLPFLIPQETFHVRTLLSQADNLFAGSQVSSVTGLAVYKTRKVGR
jgi:hypothetical protein